jgi:hypothetical protein
MATVSSGGCHRPEQPLGRSTWLPPPGVNVVAAVVYAVTAAGSAIAEWNYFILGILTEVAALTGVAYYAWTWPKVTDAVAGVVDHSPTPTTVPAERGMHE